MKYFSRIGVYAGSNFAFDPIVCRAHSYRWWMFVEKIKGQVVFNSYPYSNTTIQHQYKVRRLMSKLGINIDLEIEAPDGLQKPLISSIHHYAEKIAALENEISRPHTHKAKNAFRRSLIKNYQGKIKLIKRLQKMRGEK